MIINSIRLPVDHTYEMLRDKVNKKAGYVADKIIIKKKSTDARGGSVFFVYTVDALKKGEKEQIHRLDVPKADSPYRPIVVGSGPAGLFCAYVLSRAGLCPIVFERGDRVEERTGKIDLFFAASSLDTESNIQFGEGGAGTFSDGKLTTLISSPYKEEVLRVFVECGAPEEILYQAKPHIGTDKLRLVVKNLREKIISMGGEFHFNEKVCDIEIRNGKITGIITSKDEYPCSDAVFAIGHSARDTFDMLYKKGLAMIGKAFSIGVRIEHLQENINKAQYKSFFDSPYLGAADYKLSHHAKTGRGVYTFCMCPGGVVVGAASEEGMVCTNGMSFYARDKANANSAVLVSVTPEDFPGDGPLSGIELQRMYERAAFNAGGGGFFAPVQKVGDFFDGGLSDSFYKVEPSYRPGVTPFDMNKLFPSYIADSMKEAITEMGKRLKGFDDREAVLTGIETRSSSPVRILRNEGYVSNIEGIYPSGEGAGYAGGITSSAIDGIKCALGIVEKYKKVNCEG